jgi:hypothetical protein
MSEHVLGWALRVHGQPVAGDWPTRAEALAAAALGGFDSSEATAHEISLVVR